MGTKRLGAICTTPMIREFVVWWNNEIWLILYFHEHPREFSKFHFGAVGFRDVRPRKVPGWFHTGAKAFFGLKIFKISKLSGMIDMMSPKKKLNGEGGLLCLWASVGAFKSTISANSSIWPTVPDFELSEVNCQLQGRTQRKNPPQHIPIDGL